MLRGLFKPSPMKVAAATTTARTIAERSEINQPLQQPFTPPRSAPIPIPENDLKVSPNRHHKRKRYSYEENHTASLGLFASTDTLEQYQDDPYALLDLAEENIVEHARRRVELFFYILVAYYQSGMIPENGHITMQFGRGRSSPSGLNITQACHSSLFGSLEDTNHSPPRLEGTHLSHSLNSTVELPAFVNKFDDVLENDYHCRDNGLAIIRRVSSGELNPVEGLCEFFKMMQETFENIRSNRVMKKNCEPYMSRKSSDAPAMLKHRLLQLVEQGTFANKWNVERQQIEAPYIQLLLQIKPEELTTLKLDLVESAMIYEEKIKFLQRELLQVEETTSHLGSII